MGRGAEEGDGGFNTRGARRGTIGVGCAWAWYCSLKGDCEGGGEIDGGMLCVRFEEGRSDGVCPALSIVVWRCTKMSAGTMPTVLGNTLEE